jgi:transposase-like protein
MKRTPGKRDAKKDAYWAQVIEKARQCADGVSAYCKANGVSISNYYFWFNRLRKQHPEWRNNLPNQHTRKSQQSAARLMKEPQTEVAEKATRRRFTGEYKAQILRETELASTGETSAILRREGLYSSHLHKWRLERDERLLAPKRRGPKANPLSAENKKLRAENARLEKRVRQQELMLELQKKIAEILTMSQNPTEEIQ